MTRLARLLSRDLASALEPLGLAPAQYAVLREVWKTDGLTQRDLALRLDVEQATMAKTLARMVRDGLVTRVAHPTDKRCQFIQATDRARGLKKPAKAAARMVDTLAFGSLSEKEQARFLDVSARIIASLGTPRVGAPPSDSLTP